jgi:hypothetical protein
MTKFTLNDWPIIVSTWAGTKLTSALAGGMAEAAGGAAGVAGGVAGGCGAATGGAAGGLTEEVGGVTNDAPGLGGMPAFGAGSPSVCGCA